MRSILRSGFFWQFIGGFAIGAIGIVSLHPAEATQHLTSRFASHAHIAH